MHQLIELLTSGTKIALLQPRMNHRKATSSNWKENHIHVHGIKVGRTFEVSCQIIIHVLLLATWRHLNTKNRYVLAPVYTHMANILQPSWLKVATSWNFLEIIGTKGWWIVKSMYYYLVTLNSVVTDLSRRGAISWHSDIFLLCKNSN